MSHSAADKAPAHGHTTPTPYRIPIQLLQPGTTTARVPDFHVCLIDQLLTRQQQAEKRRAQNTAALSDAAATLHIVRPVHDRLPLLMAVSSTNPAATDGAASSVEVACGVNLVTLLQPNDAARWHAAREEWIASAADDAKAVAGGTSKPPPAVQTHHVTLAHASRCPCRAPPITADQGDGDNEEDEEKQEAAASSASAAAIAVAPSIHQHQLRLAVVVVPTLHCFSHCVRCAPGLAPDVAPCLRVLVTRRPASMRAFPGSWVFPGGACDPTDPSLAHTGLRELHEETGLDLRSAADDDEEARMHMHIVSLWEAVYPVIRPSTLPQEQPFTPKARYLIVMYAAQINGLHSENPQPTMSAAGQRQQERQQGSNRAATAAPSASAGAPSSSTASAASAASAASSASTSTTTTSSSRTSESGPPTCICSVPLRLCPTEVDAAVWLSGAQFDELRKHAAYFHTDSEEQLQHHHHHQHQHQQQSHQPPSQMSALHRCEADTDLCSCAELPALVTTAYADKHQHHTRVWSRNDVTSCSSSSSSSAPPSAVDAAPAAPSASSVSFLPATVRSCALYGLYPNRHGSGLAEGHLVALEEMRATGRF